MPSSTFDALGAPRDIARRLAARGIVDSFPIQAATIPDALAGRDVCGRAPTGSGKTIAFGIPLVVGVTKARPRRPHGLVLLPTRELAVQVGNELRMLSGPKGPSILTVHGGVGFGAQIDRLRRGVDIVVACPGRLIDLLEQRQLELDAVEMVVVDEADRLADMGFLPDIRRVLDRVPSSRQTLLFSATLDGAVDVLVRSYQRDPVRYDVEPDRNHSQSRHVFWKVARADRVGVLAEVLATQSPAIVFCRTKHGVDRLVKHLVRLGTSATGIHGGRSQSQRTRALSDFTAGRAQALIATDVAARGIHVDDVALVVHFDLAGSETDYLHRSGRTGRAGKDGLVLSFVAPDQHAAASALQRRFGPGAMLEPADVAGLHRDRPANRPRTRSGPPRRSRGAKRPPARNPRAVRRRR